MAKIPKTRRRKSPSELAALILEHNPGASIEMIANVISEWGELADDEPPDQRRASDSDSPRQLTGSNGKRPASNKTLGLRNP